MPGVHLYGKGRAGVGLVSAVWVTGTEPAHSAITSHSLQLRHVMPLYIFRDTTVPPVLPWVTAQDDGNVLYLIILLFLLGDSRSSSVLGFGIGSCSGRALP